VHRYSAFFGALLDFNRAFNQVLIHALIHSLTRLSTGSSGIMAVAEAYYSDSSCSWASETAQDPVLVTECRNGLDFTILFHQILSIVPPCLFLLLAVLRVRMLWKSSTKTKFTQLGMPMDFFAHVQDGEFPLPSSWAMLTNS